MVNRCKHPVRWKPEEDEYMRAKYPELGGETVAMMLGRSAHGVRVRAQKLGLRVDPVHANKRRLETLRANLAAGKVHKPRHKQQSKTIVVRLVRYAPLQGEPKITSATKVTIAPPIPDRWAASGPVRSVVDSGQCREWARYAA
jgi:hypothetical protein